MFDISNELEDLLVKINKGDGSLSKLLNQDSIYNELSNAIKSMDQLLIDVKENPKRYVNISLWGSDKKGQK